MCGKCDWRESSCDIKMAGKTLGAARELREKFLMEFQSACDDLEEEIKPPETKQPNVRKIKIKMNLVRTSYDDAVTAHAQVVTLEKTSASDEVNRSWVKVNLRQPFKKVIEAAEDKLGTLGADDDLEAETKVQVAQEKRDAQYELATFEAKLRASVGSLGQAISDTTIWLSDNHNALTESAEKLDVNLTKQHLVDCRNLLRLLPETEANTEGTRQQEFRTELGPKIADLKIKLVSKTPARGPVQVPAVPVQQVQGGKVGSGQLGAQRQGSVRVKMKMSAMPIPRFSGKVVDYPEWKKLFKDCVESQYEESAAVITLRTQALPDSLVNMVPRCADLTSVWDKLDKKFLDPSRVWKGVKSDLLSLDRKKLGMAKYMVDLVNKLMDAEILLDSVGMVHWLRQEDKIPEYEDFLSQDELLQWVRLKPKLTGTPWENFKNFLLKMRDEYEELAKAGTVEHETDKVKIDKVKNGVQCDYCDGKNHTEANCWKKRNAAKEPGKSESKRRCWKCGSTDHLSRECTGKVNQSNNNVKVTKKDTKKDTQKDAGEYEIYSNYLRTKDCRWCARTYNSPFTCSGCSTKWAAKSKADHCLAHCSKYAGASAKERGEMVIKGDNCLICLHHEHSTDSCFGIDQQRTICGMDGCKKRHHPLLHSAPQSTVQAVQTASHLLPIESGETDPGVTEVPSEGAIVADQSGLQGRFMSRVNSKKVQCHKVTWTKECWTGGTEVRLEQQRAKELREMLELLKLPVVDGDNVLLLMQTVTVKYGPRGEMTEMTVFWDNGSTCSLILTETAELLGCPGEPVTVSIDTINGILRRDTKLYCVELMNNSGERVMIKAFGVENISDVRSVVQLSGVKNKFSAEVQTQWSKISKRPRGRVHLLIGQEYAGFHPVPYEAQENLVICRTMFGQGWLITGSGPDLPAEVCHWGEEVSAIRVGRVTVINQTSHRIGVSQMKLTYTQDRDFYTMEGLGIEPPRRCPGCKGCKDCSWRGQKLSRQEAFDLEYMEDCVEFKEGKFHVRFPFLVDPKELSDNYNQVVRIAESEERKLNKEGRMGEFNDLFQKLEDLGAIEEISDSEMIAWTGAVHYVSLQHVVNEESATTSFRIVSNSSLKTPGNPHTLNNILAKGPNMLSDPYKILVRFRTYLKGLSSDVTKAYYQMLTGLLEKHVRRMVWRGGVCGAKWRVYGYKCVSFGDVPAATLLEICIRLTIKMFGKIDLKAAHRLFYDHFVDDVTSGGNIEEVSRFKGNEDPETLICDGTMPQIMIGANLVLKAVAVSGEPDGKALQKLSGTVFGLRYSTERDTLAIEFGVNVTARRRGAPTGPNITMETVHKLDQAVLTRRVLLGVVNGQFDMMGIAAPLLIKGRVAMRDLFVKEAELDWDTILPDKLRDTWIFFMKELVETGQLVYRRCVRPVGVVRQFWLVVFFDGSDNAYAAVVYCRWEMEDGSVVVRLLCSKARVAPLQKLSTPRIELNAAVVAVRLVWTVVQALEYEELPSKILIGGDSETVLAAREKSCGALGEYFGNRIGECWDLQGKMSDLVPVGLSGDGEWYHMPSRYNAADRPTRLNSKPADLGIGTEWQDGPNYVQLPFQDWPWERNFAARKMTDVVPREELTAKYRGVSAGTKAVLEVSNEILKKLDNGYITHDYDELIDMTEPMFRWLARYKSTKKPGYLTMTSRDMAIRFWFQYAMTDTKKAKDSGRLKELTLVEEQGMLVIKGRAVAGMKRLLGADFLPVVMSGHRIAELIMLKAHVDCDHKSVDVTLFTSRRYCWVVGGRKLAKTICKFCVKCRFLSKKPLTQKMASLPVELGVPCPAFSNLGVDLAGPFQVSSMLKRRGTRRGQGTMKVWSVLVMCLNTRALRIYLAPGYSTEDFLLAWTEVVSDCGVPRRVHSDRGTQLVSAAGNIESPDYDWDVISKQSGGRTQWTFCPSGAQWRNGAIESFVKRFKKSLELYSQSGLNYAELQSLFKRIASVLNSRPISARYGPRHTETDPDYLEIITPNMLLTARTGIDLPGKEYMDDDKPGVRLAYRQELEHAWWEQWKIQCFDSLLPTKSWTEEKRGVKPGDVVLINYTDKSKTGTWKLGRVESVELDEDGLVRTCVVEYRLVRSDLPAEELRIYFKGLKFKKIRVPVQRLSLILPVEEQKVAADVASEVYEDIIDREEQEVATDVVSEVYEDVVDKEENNLVNKHKVANVLKTINDSEVVFHNSDRVIEDLESDVNEVDVELNGTLQITARNILVDNFRKTGMKKKKVQKTSKTIQYLHGIFSTFEKLWGNCQVEETSC